VRAGKVLVIGGAGYVGCVLVEALLERGYSVRVLDRMFFGRGPVEAFKDRVELVAADMREISEEHVDDCAAVINVGGLSNDPTAEFDPQANEELNHRAAVRVAEVAKAAGVPKLIFASTASIYDRGVDDEAGDQVLDEDALVAPRAAYATTKRAAEIEILAMAGGGFAPVVFRKGTVFGFSPRMRYDLVINAFVKDALSSGTLHVFYGGRMWGRSSTWRTSHARTCGRSTRRRRSSAGRSSTSRRPTSASPSSRSRCGGRCSSAAFRRSSTSTTRTA